jgi:hypothetical protein
MNAPMKELTDLIRKRDDWQRFLTKSPNSIRITPHPRWPDVFVFSYNMIETKWATDRDYLRACRGSVIEVNPSTRECRVICYAFDKFFNVHEGAAAQIDWKTARVNEKVDGSLVKHFWYRGEPQWMLNNSPNPDCPLPDTIQNDGRFPTFQSIIDAAIPENSGLSRTEGWTLMFEACSPYNTVVLRYPEPKLWLLGARRNEPPYEEISMEMAKVKFDLRFDTPRPYLLDSQESIQALLESDLNDGTHEGVVVVDERFNRVKMKAESYLALHRLKDNDGQMTTKRLWETISLGMIDDVVGAWPEYKERADEMIEVRIRGKETLVSALKYLVLVATDPALKRYDDKRRKKEYALLVMGTEKYKAISSLAFDVYDRIGKGLIDYSEIVDEFAKKTEFEKFSKIVTDLASR